MADTVATEQRSRIMAAVKSRNTRPEIAVRSLLHRLGFRFRVHRADLPGTPDIVLPRFRAVVFVHGCFWHGHRDCDAATLPASNVAYWSAKVDRNMRRDRCVAGELRARGWSVIVVWECETKATNLLGRRLALALDRAHRRALKG